jgi:hypothetical protein
MSTQTITNKAIMGPKTGVDIPYHSYLSPLKLLKDVRPKRK